MAREGGARFFRSINIKIKTILGKNKKYKYNEQQGFEVKKRT